MPGSESSTFENMIARGGFCRKLAEIDISMVKTLTQRGFLSFNNADREKLNSAQKFVKTKSLLLLISFPCILHNQLKFHNFIELNYKVLKVS